MESKKRIGSFYFCGCSHEERLNFLIQDYVMGHVVPKVNPFTSGLTLPSMDKVPLFYETGNKSF